MTLSEARILVVDDEEALRVIFSKWLTRAGCAHVRTAANGQLAVDALRAEPADILITDVRMPVMDGVELVRKLSDLGYRLSCIIFVSGFGDVDQREMYDLGVEAFLSKPFTLEELSVALANVVAVRETLWSLPMLTPPRQMVEFDVPVSADLCFSDADVVKCFRVGRGGFSVRTTESVGIGKIAFRCRFGSDTLEDTDTVEMCGQGYVRWRSHADQTIGIEFFYLESPAREWIVEQFGAMRPRGFIPAL